MIHTWRNSFTSNNLNNSNFFTRIYSYKCSKNECLNVDTFLTCLFCYQRIVEHFAVLRSVDRFTIVTRV